MSQKLKDMIFKFFTTHEGGDVILVRNLAIKRFKLSDEEYNEVLAEWRFKQKPANA